MARRFPTPWREEKFSGGYVVSLGRVPCRCTYHESGTQPREGRDHVAIG